MRQDSRTIDPAAVFALRSPAAALEVMRTPLPGFGLTEDDFASNPVPQAVGTLFAAMGLDRERLGQPDWNPLGDLLTPGERVAIKPNLVFHEHYKGGRLHGVVTDPRLIRAVADFVFRAIGPEGELVIGDAPLQSADWNLLCGRTGLRDLPGFYARQGLRCELRDFRTVESTNRGGLKLDRKRLEGDAGGYRPVDLGAQSAHQGRPWETMRVTNYDPTAMRAHHNGERHEYLISGSLLDATAVINLAKLKTHRKAGLTGPLKNLVGINGCKDWLPHHTKGSTTDGGDEYSHRALWKQLSTWLVEREETSDSQAAKRGWNTLRKSVWLAGRRLASDTSWEGSWHGNDTLWRTIIDLNRAARYADAQGKLQPTPQRKFLVIVDALLAGEGEGPMAPSPVPMGVLLGGMTPAAVELVATRLAGWPEQRLPVVLHAFQDHPYALTGFGPDQVSVRAFDAVPGDRAGGIEPIEFAQLIRHLEPCQGWRGLFEEAGAGYAHAS
jgi:uncharacterized protein (DUF362 family)